MNLLDLADEVINQGSGNTDTGITQGHLDDYQKQIIVSSFSLRKKLIFGLGIFISLLAFVVGMPDIIISLSHGTYENLIFDGGAILLFGFITSGVLYSIFIGRIQSEIKRGETLTIKTTIRALELRTTISAMKTTHPKYFHTTFIFSTQPKESYAIGDTISLTFLPKSATIITLKKI